MERGVDHPDPGAGKNHPGPENSDDERAEDDVSEGLHPAGAAIVRDQPPDAEDAHGDGYRRHGASRSRPAVHGLGAAVVSRIPRTTPTACPMLSSPSSMRMRWARQPTATAFTSSGTT